MSHRQKKKKKQRRAADTNVRRVVTSLARNTLPVPDTSDLTSRHLRNTLGKLSIRPTHKEYTPVIPLLAWPFQICRKKNVTIDIHTINTRHRDNILQVSWQPNGGLFSARFITATRCHAARGRHFPAAARSVSLELPNCPGQIMKQIIKLDTAHY